MGALKALRTPNRMQPPNDLTQTIRQVLARHQRQVIRRSLIAAGLTLACLAMGWWRLSAAGASTVWAVALGTAGLTLLILWQGFLIRRDWLSAAALTMQLDRAFGLQARLVTAAEFADMAEPPPLYDVLIQETQQTLSGVASRLPRATGRSTWVLAAVLLLLWLWPHRGAALQQLAMRPPQLPAPIPPVPPPPAPPQDQQHQQGQQDQQQPRQASSDSSRSSSGSQGQQPQPSPSHGASGQQAASQQQPQGGSSKSSSSASEKGASEQARGQGGQPQPQGAQADAAGGGSRDTGQAKPHDGAEPSASQQQQSSGGEPRQDKPSSGDQQPSAAGASQRAKQPARQEDRAAGGGAGGDQQKAASAGSKQASGGAGSSSANAGTSPGDAAVQAALKGDIQQLLKELSGELQTLQAQAAQTPSDQPHALPGTATDPKLYDDTAEPLASNAGGRPLAIALKADAQSTSKTRPGGGTAPPSGEVSGASPQQSEEAVALAEPSADASAVHRQAIPPEYQPVFERLSQRHDTSSKP